MFKYVEYLENFIIVIFVWKIFKFWKYYNMNKEKERKIIIVWIKKFELCKFRIIWMNFFLKNYKVWKFG